MESDLKAGRFFGEFGRLAYIHDHELPFVNRPLVLDQYIGGESRTDGVQLNWLLPVEHYVSLTVGVGNQFGGDNPPNNVGDFRHLGGWNYWGRLSTYFDLTPDISLEPGISGLWNPKTTALDPRRRNLSSTPDGNTFTERERRLVGADLVLSWKPLRNNQFQSLTWGTEVLYSDNRYDVSDHCGWHDAQPLRRLPGPVLVSHVQVPPAVVGRVPVRRWKMRRTSRPKPPPTHRISRGRSATGTSCASNIRTPTTMPHPACAPIMPFICNGRGSSAHTRMAGSNADYGKEKHEYEIQTFTV